MAEFSTRCRRPRRQAAPWRAALVPLLLAGCVDGAEPGGTLTSLGLGQSWEPVLNSVPAWSAAAGQPDSATGISVARIGDVDGDGFDEVAVGVPGYDGGQVGEGAVLVFAGSALGLEEEPLAVLEGGQAFAHCGVAVSGGDVDGDGLADVFAGAPGWDGEAGAGQGRVLGWSGPDVLVGGAPTWLLDGPEAGAGFGHAVTVEGDFDFDGLHEVAASAPQLREGLVLVFAGTAQGPDPTGLVLAGPEDGAALGWSLASGADLDGDGFDDLLAGAPGWGLAGPGGGAALLFSGGSEGLGGEPSWELAPAGLASWGSAVALAGDVHGDGFVDVLIGGPMLSAVQPGEGGAALVAGGPSGLEDVVQWSTQGLNSGVLLGSSVSGAGDLDGDGLDEIAIGAPLREGVAADGGGVAVFRGDPAGPSVFATLWLDGQAPAGWFGAAVAGVGDTDGDGHDDLLVGAADPTAGAAFLFRGQSADPVPDLDGDGWCDATVACGPGLLPGDCDDNDAAVHPSAEEICDRKDTDCDGVIPVEENDDDADGLTECEGDCDDSDPSVLPGVPELCDDRDHNCDGFDGVDALLIPFYPDVDGDGHGDPQRTPTLACEDPPPGTSRFADDCDDLDPYVHPDAPELFCNGIDDDCASWSEDMPDLDGDGVVGCMTCEFNEFGLPCGDCDDGDNLVGPTRAERCENGVDDDCDGGDADCPRPEDCDEPDEECDPNEPTCSSAGRPPLGAGLLLLALAWLMMSRFRGIALLCLLVAGPAQAGSWKDMDSIQFRPTMNPWGFYRTPGAQPGHAGTLRIGAISSYEQEPLVLVHPDGERYWLVPHRGVVQAGAWGAITDFLGVGASMPLAVFQDVQEGPVWALGDLQSQVLLRFASSRNVAAALVVDAWFPTSTEFRFVGERMPRVRPAVALQAGVGRFVTAVDLGLMFREYIPTGYGFGLGHELWITAAARFWVLPSRLAVLAELTARTRLVRPFENGGETPAELRVGARIIVRGGLQIDVAAAGGLGAGYGSPTFRLVIGGSWLRQPPGRRPLEPIRRPPPDVYDLGPEELIVDDMPDDPEQDLLTPEELAEPEEEPSAELVANGPLAKLEDDRIVIYQPIQFEHDSDVLLSASFPILEAVAGVLDANPEIAHVLVEGHASVEGTVEHNYDLSARRAWSVLRWLIEGGVHPGRLSSRGMGEVVPTGLERLGAVIDADRRVEFHVVRVLSTWTDDIPDWGKDPIPVPWSAPEEEAP